MQTSPSKAIDLVIEPRPRDLGGFSVLRVLPYAKRRMVGPFIFFDELGPVDFAPGEGVDVRPHPHIGLATVSYLFAGELRHKDDLGTDLIIHPGDVNWMTAGRGIVHSERTDADKRASGQTMHLIQTWVALPAEHEDTDPAFDHFPKAVLPTIEREKLSMRLIAGAAFGEASPVKTFSPMFYLAAEAEAGANIPTPSDHEERALYIVEGTVAVDGAPHGAGRLLVFKPGAEPSIVTQTPVKAMLLGGVPLGERRIWWNLVATSDEKIEAAKRAWTKATEEGFKGDGFGLPPGETDFIPLPDK
ncbi:MAG: pirin family protein [Pseudomonadota bacterium]